MSEPELNDIWAEQAIRARAEEETLRIALEHVRDVMNCWRGNPMLRMTHLSIESTIKIIETALKRKG